MTLRVRVLNAGRLERRLARLGAARRQAVGAAVLAGAGAVRDEARRRLGRGGGLGRSGGPGLRSAAGEAPRAQSGRLAASVTVRRGPGGLAADVGSDLDYGRHLEFGTRRLAARPWLLPAFRAVADVVRRGILAAGRGGSDA